MARGKAQKTLELIDAARRILEEIQPATVRAVCYRLFVEQIIPSMEKVNTNRVSTQLVWAREQGIIPWSWIVDETREAETVGTWSSPMEIFEAAAQQFRYDYWQEQPARLEVWSEKGTVRGTLWPVLKQYAVTLRVMHGHASATAVNDAAELSNESDKPLTVLYVGDRDPSGMHMSEVDLPERIARYGGEIEIKRIAIDLRDTWSLRGPEVPSFAALDKVNDPRYEWYVRRYGHKCWELDALSPKVLRARVEEAIRERLDLDAWNHAARIEAAQRETTKQFMASFQSISMPATKYDDEGAE
jgi:hypothetical protein